MTDNIPEDADPWQYARRPKGFTTKREFLEYLKERANQEGAYDLLAGIDTLILELIREHNKLSDNE